MIHASTLETFFTIFAFCCNFGSRVMTSQVVIMTKSVSIISRVSKKKKSEAKNVQEINSTVLVSVLLLEVGYETENLHPKICEIRSDVAQFCVDDLRINLKNRFSIFFKRLVNFLFCRWRSVT